MVSTGAAAYLETGTLGIRVSRMLEMLTPSTDVEGQALFRSSGCARQSNGGHCDESGK